MIWSEGSWIKQKPGPALIYCDGGHKYNELALYNKILRQGDVMGCHDYGTEVNMPNADKLMKESGLDKYIAPHSLKELATLQQFWVKL